MPDSSEIQRAIRNAERHSHNYSSDIREEEKGDVLYWKLRYEHMQEEMCRYRDEAWSLRNEFLDLRETITKALERSK